MRSILLFISFCLILNGLQSAESAFVKYTDRNGKIHYVNTDYAKVPDEYLPQVQEQISNSTLPQALPQSTPSEQPTSSITIPKDYKPITLEPIIEVFVKPNCPDCDRFEVTLQANQIKYRRYDVENSKEGQEFYKPIEKINLPLPLTRINGQIIQGNDIYAVQTLLKIIQTTISIPPGGSNSPGLIPVPVSSDDNSQNSPIIDQASFPKPPTGQ